MKITIGGMPGAGKTTVGKILADRLGLKFYSIGTIRRLLAKERGLTIDEFNNLAEDTDTMADSFQIKLARDEDDFIVDGRLAFYFVPDSIKFYFTCSLDTAAYRIFKDQRSTENFYLNQDEIKNSITLRMKNDVERYKKLYNVNCYEPKLFDHVVDTTSRTIDEVVAIVLDCI